MPRKKKEELEGDEVSGETVTENTNSEISEETSEDEATADLTEESIINSTKTNSVEDGQPKADDAATESTSIVGSLLGAVSSVVGSVAEAVTSGVSAVVASATAEPVSETEKTQHSKRAEKIGIVQSDKMTKTVTVRVDRQVKHPIYRKYIKRRKKFMAHDEMGAAVGDKVRIVETRPLSARKRWRVVEIVQKAVK